MGSFILHLAQEERMETKVALIAVIVSDKEAAAKLNEVLHESSEYIIGRMGIPYKKEGISLISIAVDAPMDRINAITGKLGAIAGVSAKTVYPQKNC